MQQDLNRVKFAQPLYLWSLTMSKTAAIHLALDPGPREIAITTHPLQVENYQEVREFSILPWKTYIVRGHRHNPRVNWYQKPMHSPLICPSTALCGESLQEAKKAVAEMNECIILFTIKPLCGFSTA